MVNLVETQKSFFVTDWLDRRAKLSGDRIALHDALSGRDISYRAWNAIANRPANMLDSLGVQAGDRVAISSTNCVEYLDLLMACNKTGAVLQVLNWRLAIPEMRAVLNDAAPVVQGPHPDRLQRPPHARRGEPLAQALVDPCGDGVAQVHDRSWMPGSTSRTWTETCRSASGYCQWSLR